MIKIVVFDNGENYVRKREIWAFFALLGKAARKKMQLM